MERPRSPGLRRSRGLRASERRWAKGDWPIPWERGYPMLRLGLVAVALFVLAACGTDHSELSQSNPWTPVQRCGGRDVFNQTSAVDLAIVLAAETSSERVADLADYLIQAPDSVGLDSVDVDYSRNLIFLRMRCDATLGQFDQLVDDMKRFPEIERTEQRVTPSSFAE
jgi:hypothetical protein